MKSSQTGLVASTGMRLPNMLSVLRLLLMFLACGSAQASGHLLDGEIVKDGLGSLAATLAPIYLPVSVSPSSPCGQALQAMAASLASNSSWWAAKMVDSWGKTLDGTGMFNRNYLGNFEECVHTTADGLTGKYCKINTYWTDGGKDLSMPEGSPLRPDVPWVRGLLKKNARSVVSAVHNSNTHFGTCMPSVCTKQELEESLITVLLPQGMYSIVTFCSELDPPVKFTTQDIGFTAFLTFLVVFIACASLVDVFVAYTGNQRLARGALRYLLVFSAYTNLGKIFQVNPSSTPGTISCLNGMRVLSMTWVIYCHQYTMPLGYMINISSIFTILSDVLGQIVLNGYPSVDTFFFLSGLLVSYSVLRAAKRTGGRFNLPLFFAHRIIRLVPAIGIVAGLVATVLRFFVTGPVANDWVYLYEACKNNWWKDVLFVSNLLQKTGDCIGQAWYLGVDMQLYLVAPIIIYPLYWYNNSGKAWLFLLTVFSAVIPAAITYKFDMPPTVLQGQVENSNDIFYKRYMVPWCRASPWLAGVWVGYFFYRQGNTRYKMSPVIVVTGWTLASLTGLLVVFGMYSYNQMFFPEHYDVMTQLVYSGLHRLAWGAALGWMVFACYNGYGGVVNDFLSHPAWQPFSRLTYTTYLVAVQMQYLITDNLKTAYYLTNLNTIISTVGSVFFSVIASVCVSLMAESPVLGLERLLLRPSDSADNKITKSQRDENGASAPPISSLGGVEAHTALTTPSLQQPVRQDNSLVFTMKENACESSGHEAAPDVNGAAAISYL